MNHSETRGTVVEVVDIKNGGQTINALKRNEDPTFTVGGILSDFELAWLHHGAYLKVINISDGTVQSAWDFSAIIRDNKAEITSVIEYEINEQGNRAHSKEAQQCLIVSYTSTRDSNKASFISFCHPRTSKILHTITSKEKITCLSLITTKKNHSSPLTGIVKMMSGALAIGTKSGNLLIMDIKGYDLINEIFNCSRKPGVCDLLQNRVSCMLILDLKQYNENDIKDKICKVDDDNYHVAISIPVTERKDCNSYDLEISCLMYIPQGLTLAVGFRSGVFQLWDVSTLKRLYRSSSLSHPTPVVKFGFQEPCNDPQSFCYLWVLHESRGSDACLPFAVMYGILYKKVITTQDYGRCYKTFMHCKKRFDMDVDMERSSNGRCITCSVVSNTPSNMLRHINTNEDPSKINLFVMVFETWENVSDVSSHITLVVFDMNQWYKAQMPHQCYNGYAVPFINFVLLDRVSERKSTILDMRIKKDSIQQFLTFNLSEEYSYPSSLSFDTVFLTNTKLIHLRVPGIQRCIIEQIVAEGPSGLIKPSKYFTDCKEVGLRPCFSDNYGQVIVPSQIQQRNYILTILLEHKMSNFLVRCVNEWADGSRAVSGCTLPNLIQWAWDCVTRIKQLTDTICIPLFDYSGDDLDRENYQKLKHCCQLLQLIRDLLSYTWKHFKHFLLDFKRLNHQVETLHLVTKYFDVIIWCLDVGLLPEKVTSTSDRCIPTYMLNLMQFAEQRREELKAVAMKDKYFLTDESTLYIIDSILDNELGGRSLRLQWERESYGMTNGFYPPVTLQSLLRMFLMSNVSTEAKHFIMMYFLLDVCDYHRDEEMKEQLLSFSIIFFPDSKFLSLVEACWLIDHEKFEEAADIILTDSVMSLLRKNKNLYETILKSCVCQKQYALALKCERIIKLSASFKNESFHITLLLLNELIMEAYSTLRKISFEDSKMLQNFFKVCDELGFLKEVFRLPLLPEEETEFLSYLDNCINKDAGDLKVMYLLSRGRYVEAVDINHNMGTKVPKFAIVGKDTQKQDSGGRTTTRDLLVNAFSKTLPNVTNDLINFCRKERDKIYRHKHIAKPTPLSVVVHTDTEKSIPVYKSSFESVMQAAICKTAETWSNFPRIDKRNKNVSFTQNTPFLRSDLMTPKQKRCNISFRSASKDKAPEEKKDPDEPPSKRVKRNLDISLNNVTKEADDTLESAPLEVTRILRTPHVQKRLNKLLQNTPESSPLTSILKSSEMSRFKQPQKVGFSVPERQRNTPNQRIVNVGENATTPVPEERVNSEEPRAKKSLAKDFDKSNEILVEVQIENRIDTSVQTNESTTSHEATEKDESYYSLESEHENENVISFMLDESKVEEDPATKSKRLFMECMSDEETPNMSLVEPQNTSITINLTQSIDVYSNESAISQPIQPENMEVDRVSYDTQNPVELNTDAESLPVETEMSVPLGVITTTRGSHFDEDFYQKAYASICSENYDINVSEESKSAENFIEDQNQNVDDAQTLDYEQEYDTESDKIVSDEESEYSNEDDDAKSQNEEEAVTDDRNITQVVESSAEDSDIEIIDDNTVPVIQSSMSLREQPSSDREEVVDEEQLSESTYESECSYSDENESIVNEEESEVEEQSIAEEEENIYVDDSSEEAEEEEYENDNEEMVEEEEEVQENTAEHKNIIVDYEQFDCLTEPSSQINYEELKNIVSTIAAAEESKASESNARADADIENIPVVNETYAKEMYSVNESTINVSESNSVLVANDSQIVDASVSICEVYDATQSILEETVNLSDIKSGNEDENRSIEIISQTIDSNCSAVNTPNVTGTKSDDPEDASSLVFYFGENSVTSIGNEVVVDDSSTGDKSENKCEIEDQQEPQGSNETSESSGEQLPDTKTDNNEDHSVQNVTKFSTTEGSPVNVKCTSVKEHNFLRTSLPECNVHIIEKVRNEMYSSDDGYDDSDVQVDATSDEVPQTVSYTEESPVVINTTHFQKSVFADESQTSTMETGEKSTRVSELMSEKDISVDVSIVQMSQEVSQTSQTGNEQNNTVTPTANQTSVIIEPRDEKNSQSEVVEDKKDVQVFSPSKVNLPSPVVSIKVSESSGLLESCANPEQTPNTTGQQVTPSPPEHEDVQLEIGSASSSVTPAPQENTPEESSSTRRRSVRIAKRRSIDCIPEALEENPDFDDAMSVKSGSSVAESVISNVTVASGSSVNSNRSRRRKSVAPPMLEVIVSDEELISPQKPIVAETVSKTFKPRYSASEPGKERGTAVKRKRSARSEVDFDEDDKLSSVSESGARKEVHKRNVRRKSDLNEAVLQSTPTPSESKRLGRFVSSTPLVLNKAKNKPPGETSAEIEKYASSRRLTRSQKLYLEYGFAAQPKSSVLPSKGVEKLEEIEEIDSEYSLCVEEDEKAADEPTTSKAPIKPILVSRKTTPKKDKPNVQPIRFSKRLSGRFSPLPNEDSISSEEPPSPAKSISSVAESNSSRASSASRRSLRNRRTYTSMELRRSSVRPNFKPLAVIPSDDESQLSFQLPTPTKNVAEDSFHSSAESTLSKASNRSRTRRKTQSECSEDVSDKESSVSDVSTMTGSSVSSRKRMATRSDDKRSGSESSTISAPTKRGRLTRNQMSKAEPSQTTSKKKK
ncbi:protein ELYS isoform X2 [Planococcus citri]|uniref:protein ELYS isoform X2 n=1 Tax=Planococcus citri TaxID=170843 RepID=UPI0031FA1A1D